MIDAMLLGALVAVVAATRSWLVNGLWGVLAFSLAWGWIIAHGNHRYRQEVWDARDGLVLEPEALGRADDPDDKRLASRRLTRWARTAARRLERLKFTLTPTTADPSQRVVPCRAPADELLFLLDGVLRCVDVEHEEVITVRPGDALFIPAGLLHRIETKPGDHCVTSRRSRRR